jgi:hypothetical protein
MRSSINKSKRDEINHTAASEERVTTRIMFKFQYPIGRRKSRHFGFLTVAALMFYVWAWLAGGAANAQVTGQGAISGTVADSTGAFIAGAHLTVTNMETNVSHSTVTNPTGYFVVDNVNPGVYSISAGSSGFENLERRGITLRATANLKVPLTLKPGASLATITVTADASVLDVETGSSGQVLTTKQVESLPVAGTNPTYLTMLAPGVQANISVSQNQTDTGGSNAITKNFGVFGQIGVNDFSLDGAPNMGN